MARPEIVAAVGVGVVGAAGIEPANLVRVKQKLK